MTEILTASGLIRGDKAVTDWSSIRGWVLQRDEHLCQICKLRIATDVDHIWPRRLGGEDHINNLRAACGPCNKAKGERVALSTATEANLLKAAVALDQRVQALDAEIERFEAELLLRDALGGVLGAPLRLYEAALSQRREQLDHRLARCAVLRLLVTMDALRWLQHCDPSDVTAAFSLDEIAVLMPEIRETRDWLNRLYAALDGPADGSVTEIDLTEKAI